MPFGVTWMDLEIVKLSEVSHTEKDKYMIWLIYGIFKKDIKVAFHARMGTIKDRNGMDLTEA